ncbi:MAG: DNA ligase-associated metallophosphoesterase [Paracoccaceae bacterium]|jgi:DNA ligase-associated metallophosphoesterase
MAKPLHRADPRRYLRPMTHHDISLAGAVVQARPSGALWWAGVGVLAVSDLHLGRAARRARHGGALLPPYEALATLDRLEAEIHALAPRVVISLGDSFDDAGAEARLDTAARARLIALATGRRWVWIAGNHDPAPSSLPGEHLAELSVPAPDGPVAFRHIAETAGPEVSGHWHPKARLGRGPARACFMWDGAKLILPAFGAYVGGLDVGAPPLRALMPEGLALLTGLRVIAAPLSGLRDQAGRRPNARAICAP